MAASDDTEKLVPVRTARLADAKSIARLTEQLGYEVDAATVAERLSRIVARPDQRFMVAELDERVVGWVHVMVWEFVETGPFVILGGLVVERSLRRRGIGRTLVIEAEQWALEQGCSVVRLWSSVGRTQAHRFYEQLGYSNIKNQYSFVKSVGPAGGSDFGGFIPQFDR